jgi:hypothetical protein
MTQIIGVPREMTAEEIAEREEWAAGEHDRNMEEVRRKRQNAYQQTADPLFFKFQAGEATEQEWLTARQEVVDANPYPAKTK